MSMEKIICGDSKEVLKTLDAESVDCCITSPPYFGLRDYGMEGQIGLEETPEAYVTKLVEIFREVKRVLKKDGTLWLNLGDSYASGGKMGGDIDLDNGIDVQRGGGRMKKHPEIKHKDLVGIPWMVAFALRADGWYLRQDIIWHKPNPMPESVTDRCTKAHEYIFLLSKSPKYYFDSAAIAELATTKENRPSGVVRDRESDYDSKQKAMGRHKNTKEKGQQPHSFHLSREVGIPDVISEKRNRRSVWTVNTMPYKEAHFATFPEKLIEPMILAGCPKGGTVLDPFSGAATTGLVAKKFGRDYIGIELNPEYVAMSERRLNSIPSPMF